MNKISNSEQINNLMRDGYHYHSAHIDKDGDFFTIYTDDNNDPVHVKEIKDKLGAEVMTKLIKQLTPNQKAMMKGHECWTQFTVEGEPTADEVIAKNELFIVIKANDNNYGDYVELKTKYDKRFDFGHIEIIGKDGNVNKRSK